MMGITWAIDECTQELLLMVARPRTLAGESDAQGFQRPSMKMIFSTGQDAKQAIPALIRDLQALLPHP